MSPWTIALIATCSLAVLLAKRSWAPLPLLVVATCLTVHQAVDLGPVTMTAIRIVIAAAVLRVLVRGEVITGGLMRTDWWVVVWAFWVVASSALQPAPMTAFVFRLGQAFNYAGTYFLLRVFCSTRETAFRLVQVLALLMVPLGLEMLYEALGNPSLFYVLEGLSADVTLRQGRIRAVGPFLSPITAGTVGAVCVPLFLSMWYRRRLTAVGGVLAALVMVVSSASSGPLLSLLFGVGAMCSWPFRRYLRALRWSVVAAYVGLATVMKAPVYYLLARVDLAGGSTGWHRAKVIESAIAFLPDWWLAGTDYTRHWAPSPGWSPNHTDITSQYLYMGVLGGLPLLFAFAMTLSSAFAVVGGGVEDRASAEAKEQFLLWSLGASLFAHCATFVSVAYFDQSFVFFCVTLGALVASGNQVLGTSATDAPRQSQGHRGARPTRPRSRRTAPVGRGEGLRLRDVSRRRVIAAPGDCAQGFGVKG